MMPCFHHRMLITRAADNNRTPPPRTMRHMEGCPACRQFHETTARVVEHLQRDADALAVDVSENLRQKILARCGLDRPAAARAKPRTLSLVRVSGWALAAAAAVLLAVGLWVSLAPTPPVGTGRPIAQPDPNPTPVSPTATPVRIVVDLTPADAADAATRLAQPLQDELDRLREDGKAAAEFLLACVPIDMDRVHK